MLPLKTIGRFIKALHSSASPQQIALGRQGAGPVEGFEEEVKRVGPGLKVKFLGKYRQTRISQLRLCLFPLAFTAH